MTDELNVRKFEASDMPDQTGKTVVITGANNGLGLQAAQALAGVGARIVLACRNQQTGRQALALVARAGAGADHALVELDLSDLASVRRAARTMTELTSVVDVLINNAGVMAVPFARTADGFEMQIGTNHLGHFALTDALLPALLRAPQPRVVTLSSVAHRHGRIVVDDLNFERRRYGRMRAYGQAKLANLLFSDELARRTAASGSALVSVAAHPGVAATNLFDSMVPPVPGALKAAHVVLGAIGSDEDRGARSQLYASTMADVRNGDYLGPTRLFGVRGQVARSPRSRRARDTATAVRLWERSVALTGADFGALDASGAAPRRFSGDRPSD